MFRESIENQPYNPEVAVPPAAEPFSWAGLIGTVIVFLVIMIVAFWLIKRMNRFAQRNLDSPWARVLDRQVLYGNQALYLVEIAGKIQILGATDHHITKLEEIKDPDVAAEILDDIAKRPKEKIDRVMSSIWQRFKPRRKKSFSSELERLLEEAKK